MSSNVSAMCTTTGSPGGASVSPARTVSPMLLLLFFGWFFLQTRFKPANPSPENLDSIVDAQQQEQQLGNSQAVAWELYTQHLLPFEIASIFLLIAMIGAVVLGRRL